MKTLVLRPRAVHRRALPPAALLALLVLAAACSAPADPLETAAPATPASEASEAAEPAASPSPEQPAVSEPAGPGATGTPEAADPAGDQAGAPEPPPVPAVQEGLAPGDQGEAVRVLQQQLTDLGYKPIGVDGRFGPDTQRSVEAFQRIQGLQVTGTLTAPTVQALGTAEPVAPLGPGAEGSEVAELQQRLNDGPFDAGPVDGQFGSMTRMAVLALQKLHGYPADGQVTAVERHLLATGSALPPQIGGQSGTHVEVDLGRQLTSVYRDGRLVLATHSSSGNNETFCTPAGGCRRAVTPTGDYTITRRIDGWRTSELGQLYNPLYFNGGIAFHGAHSVPTHPASHGCVRVPMWIAEYLPDLLPDGTPVYVR